MFNGGVASAGTTIKNIVMVAVHAAGGALFVVVPVPTLAFTTAAAGELNNGNRKSIIMEMQIVNRNNFFFDFILFHLL
jgi:hypothetical protein